MDEDIKQNPPQEPASYTRPSNSSPNFFDKFFSIFTKKTAAGLVILVLVIGVGAATIAVQRSTEFRQRAGTSTPPRNLQVTTSCLEPGNTPKVKFTWISGSSSTLWLDVSKNDPILYNFWNRDVTVNINGGVFNWSTNAKMKLNTSNTYDYAPEQNTTYYWRLNDGLSNTNGPTSFSTPVTCPIPTPIPKTPPCFMPKSILKNLGLPTNAKRGYGDVNWDDFITKTDENWISDVVAGENVFTEQAQYEAADVNDDPNAPSEDDHVDSKDLALIKQFLAGQILTFRVCPATTPTSTPTPTIIIDTIPPTSVIAYPPAGSLQTGNFTVGVWDSDTGGSGLDLDKCDYAVFDQGGPGVPNTPRPCSTSTRANIQITVGPNGNCRTIGTNMCNVRVGSWDHANNRALPDGRSFSITYAGATPTPTTTIIPTGTVAPTPTTTPGATPTPTPTIPVGNTVFALSIGLDGLGTTGDNSTPGDSSGSNRNPNRPSRNVRVEVFDGDDNPAANRSGTIIYNAGSGKFIGTIDMGTLASGNYNVKVKSDGYLRRFIPGIHQNVTSGQTYNLPAVNLVTGDITNDNAINILDYNILISCSIFSVDNRALCNGNPQYAVLSDLEDNGVINQFDYNLFRRELSVQNGD